MATRSANPNRFNRTCSPVVGLRGQTTLDAVVEHNATLDPTLDPILEASESTGTTGVSPLSNPPGNADTADSLIVPPSPSIFPELHEAPAETNFLFDWAAELTSSEQAQESAEPKPKLVTWRDVRDKLEVSLLQMCAHMREDMRSEFKAFMSNQGFQLLSGLRTEAARFESDSGMDKQQVARTIEGPTASSYDIIRSADEEADPKKVVLQEALESDAHSDNARHDPPEQGDGFRVFRNYKTSSSNLENCCVMPSLDTSSASRGDLQPDRIWKSNSRKTYLATSGPGSPVHHSQLTFIGSPKSSFPASPITNSSKSPNTGCPSPRTSQSEIHPHPLEEDAATDGNPVSLHGFLDVFGGFSTSSLGDEKDEGEFKRKARRRLPSTCTLHVDAGSTPRPLFMPIPERSEITRHWSSDTKSEIRCFQDPIVATTRGIRHLVEHEMFDYAIAVLILLNTVLMGCQVQYTAMAARNQIAEMPVFLTVASSTFCIIFATELLLRIGVYRRSFFIGDGWRWNTFDVTVVSLQMVEEVSAIGVLLAGAEAKRQRSASLSFMRILRVLRLVRIIRVVRILRLVRELRAMVHSIGGTLMSLLWTVLLLLLMIYVTGIVFTQLVADSVLDDPDGTADEQVLEYFGSLDRSISTLYQSISGGVNWRVPATALTERTHPVLLAVFSIYISFTVLAMLNVITGVFVGSAISKASHEENVDLVYGLREAVASMQTDGTDELSWDSFQAQIRDPNMLQFFQSIDLDPSEAEGLFLLLDPDRLGKISAEDFVMGCLRLHGDAKAIDLTALMCEVRWIRHRWVEHAAKLERIVQTTMGYKHSDTISSLDSPPLLSPHGESRIRLSPKFD